MLSLSLLLPALAASVSVSAHRFDAHIVQARQASTTDTALPASSISESVPTLTPSPTASTPVDTITPTLLSTNPTAMPLTNIIASPVTDVTYAVFTSYSIGATPPISGAPPLPSGIIIPPNWPALDLVPPTNTSEVATWMTELNGYNIPDLSVTIPGGCSTNPSIVGNASRCWWTCGECTRDTDITTCPDKMTWGLSYDDGPTPYTPALINYLETVNLHATFFIVGSRAISRPEILQDEYMGGHQLCVHTWSHPYLTTLSTEQIVAELGWTREAIKNITGVSPNCMRPPYGDIDDRVRAISLAMGMTPIIWTSYNGSDFDTNDWHIPGGEVTANDVLGTFDEVLYTYAPLLNTGFIVLEHDLYQQTVDLAVGYVIPNALAHNMFKMMPIIECLHKPLGDSYVETNNNVTNPPGTAQALTLQPTASGATLFTTGVGLTSSAGSSSSASVSGSAGSSAASPAATAKNAASPGTVSSLLTLAGATLFGALALIL